MLWFVCKKLLPPLWSQNTQMSYAFYNHLPFRHFSESESLSSWIILLILSIGGPWGDPGRSRDGDPGLPDKITDRFNIVAKHGIVICGVIAWIQVNKDIAAEGIWRQLAEAKWSNEEVTTARAAIKAAG